MQAMANAGHIIDLLNSKKDMHKQTNVQTSGMTARRKETGRNTNNTDKNHNALSTRMNSIAFNPIRTNFRCFAGMVSPVRCRVSYIAGSVCSRYPISEKSWDWQDEGYEHYQEGKRSHGHPDVWPPAGSNSIKEIRPSESGRVHLQDEL